MNIAICDDVIQEKACLLDKINDYCRCNFIEATTTEYSSGEKLLENFSQGLFDIIFLDIYMEGLNGIETAKMIRNIDQDSLLIFVTSSKDYSLEGFAVNALHYLIKPVTDEKIADVFNRSQRILRDIQQYIEVLSERRTIRILVKLIQYVEVYDKACYVYTDLEKIKTYLSLDEFHQKLSNKNFLRCHRSYIVNMLAIVSVEDNDFVLQSGIKIPIRQSEKRAIKQMYMNFLFSVTREE